MASLADVFFYSQSLAIGISFFVLFNVGFFVFTTLRLRAFPPGPRGIPGVGNLFQIDKDFPFLTYGSWTKNFGKNTPLGFKKGAMGVVVLNSRRLVLELFEKRANVYNDRPGNYMRDTWVHNQDTRGAPIANGSPWLTRWRREFTHHFGPRAVVTHRPVYEAESARLLVKLMQNPTGRRKQIQDLLLNWLMSTPCIGVCGRRPDCLGEYGFEVEQFRQFNSDYSNLVTVEKYDFFPFLRYVQDFLGPFAWRKKAREVRSGFIKYCHQFLEAAKEQRRALDSGKPIKWESMLAAMLKEKHENDEKMFSTADIGNSACQVIAAGSGSSVAFFCVLLMTLAKYPVIQQKIRDEVLNVTRGVPPTAADISNMRYLEAVWHEVHRWRPVTPQALPRATSRDDLYDGYRIPKGTTVLINAWHIQHTEEDYEDPDEFNPDRYLQHPLGMRPDAAHATDQMEQSVSNIIFTFGAGRRVCPGQQAAKQTLLLGIAKVLWAFDVLPPDNGKSVDLSLETGFVNHIFFLVPKEFDIAFKLRDERSEKDVLDHYDRAYEAQAEHMGWKNGLYK